MQIPFDLDASQKNFHEISPGTLSCQGCGAALAMKLALKGIGLNTMAVVPACCYSIIMGVWPHFALKIPVVHVPFASAGAAASGLRAALDLRGETHVTVMVWAGDGGTYDIGIQSLSGAAERNENILFVCYDNEAYMNTGIQRSGATPPGTWTTTTPAGAAKTEPKKDMEKIMLAHQAPYVATASIAYPDDLIKKFQKAGAVAGTRFIRVLAPCPPGWRMDSKDTVKVSRMAVQSRVFPLFEVENGRFSITKQPEKHVSVADYLATQGRFRMSRELMDLNEKEMNKRWEWLCREVESSPGRG